MNRALDMHYMNDVIYAPCRATIESTESTGRNHLPNRHVRFQPARYTMSLTSGGTSQTLEECKRLVWYQPADFQNFQNNNEILIQKYRSALRNNHRLGRTKLKDIEKLEMEIEAEMRGLEDNFDVISGLRHQRRLADSVSAVLIEQERQRDLWSKDASANSSFLPDAEMIRKVYSISSMNSKLIACSLGRSDAIFARQFQKLSPICDYVLHKNNNIGTEKGETKSTLQRDRAQISLKSRKEKRRMDVTASSILRQRQLDRINALGRHVYPSDNIKNICKLCEDRTTTVC